MMKRYLKNLLMALTGRNPFQVELEEARQQLEKARENMSSLQDQLYEALQRWGESQKTQEKSDAINKKLQKRIGAAEKRAASCQVLIENLREHIREKDAEMESAGLEFRERMERVKYEYQQRIDEYNKEIERLQTASPC